MITLQRKLTLQLINFSCLPLHFPCCIYCIVYMVIIVGDDVSGVPATVREVSRHEQQPASGSRFSLLMTTHRVRGARR